MAEHISQREAQSAVARLDGVQERQRQQKFMLSEVMAGFGAGALTGYLITKQPQLAAFGPGGVLHLDHIVALGGLWLGRKRTRTAAFARGAGIQALGQIGREIGAKNA